MSYRHYVYAGSSTPHSRSPTLTTQESRSARAINQEPSYTIEVARKVMRVVIKITCGRIIFFLMQISLPSGFLIAHDLLAK